MSKNIVMNNSLVKNGIEWRENRKALARYEKELEEKLAQKQVAIEALREDQSQRHTHTEFALFGVGMCIIGMILSLAIMWNLKKYQEDSMEYDEDIDDQDSVDNIFEK